MYKRSEVEKNALDYFKDNLIANVWLDKYALKSGEDQYIESSPDDTLVRLAKELYRIEMKYQNPMDYDTVYGLLKDYNKLVLGGSNLFGIGNTTTLSTLGNCFVVDSPIDSYSGIFKTDQELAQLMKRRGGVGVDISSIRPKGSKVNNAASSSTGAVSFLERFSNTTREVAQEGRRGALMVTMNINHPDIEQFVTAKDDLTKITGANISVKVTDEFMTAVEEDSYWLLYWCAKKDDDLLGSDILLMEAVPYNQITELYGDPYKIAIKIRARELWNKIIYQAWKNGEPGILFWDKVLRDSPADCYPEFPTITTNPCSELPLCAYDSCRLAAINIYAYVTNPFTDEAKFNYEEFQKDVIRAQRIMDNIVDLEIEKISAILSKITSDPEPRGIKNVELDLWNRILSKLFFGRRTGLGMMGLADALAALGCRYGSPESWQFASELGAAFATSSYYSSITMGKERGSFVLWNRGLEKGNSYISRVLDLMYDFGYTDAYEMYQITGRRNVANLTIAPTGSISMLAKVSSGIEPIFALTYNRKRKVSADNPNKSIQDKNGDWWEEYIVYHPKLFLLPSGVGSGAYENSVAHEVPALDKLELQAIMQKYIDHSISITYNLPNSATEKDVSDLYMKAWKLDLKGLTVYREGSRDGVLTTKKQVHFSQTDAPKRPKTLLCDIYSMMSKGKHWIVCVGLLDGKPYEVFAFNEYNLKEAQYIGELIKVNRGKYNLNIKDVALIEDITQNCSDEENLLTRMISTSLRHGADIKFVVEQLSKSEGDITSFGKAIARTLKRYVIGSSIKGVACSECGTTMISEGGCLTCRQCGNSKCE